MVEFLIIGAERIALKKKLLHMIFEIFRPGAETANSSMRFGQLSYRCDFLLKRHCQHKILVHSAVYALYNFMHTIMATNK